MTSNSSRPAAVGTTRGGRSPVGSPLGLPQAAVEVKGMSVAVTGVDSERLRLMVIVARLYHVHGVRQREVATRLGLSQARVSRLLGQAEQLGIVRTVIAVPDGVHPGLEDHIEQAYDVREVHVVAQPHPNADIAAVLGRAAAQHFGEATLSGARIGFTSWSRTLREMAFVLRSSQARGGTTHVVEMLGGLGPPTLQHSATRATQALASALGAEPVFLRTPGVVTDQALRAAALRDPHVQRALALLGDLDVAFVGVGPADVHSELRPGQNFFDSDQLALARAAGATAQLNQRFLGPDGSPVDTSLDDLVVGTTLAQLRSAARRVVVAGGPGKHAAVGSALAGGWVDVLVTDVVTAQHLVDQSEDARPLARVLTSA